MDNNLNLSHWWLNECEKKVNCVLELEFCIYAFVDCKGTESWDLLLWALLTITNL